MSRLLAFLSHQSWQGIGAIAGIIAVIIGIIALIPLLSSSPAPTITPTITVALTSTPPPTVELTIWCSGGQAHFELFNHGNSEVSGITWEAQRDGREPIAGVSGTVAPSSKLEIYVVDYIDGAEYKVTAAGQTKTAQLGVTLGTCYG